MNPLIERIEFLKKSGADAVSNYPAITSVTLGVVHENIAELLEAAEYYEKVAEPLYSSQRLFFMLYDVNTGITISVTSKDAVHATFTYSIN